MTEQILDIEKWIKKYHFLKDVWNTYDEFDQTVEYDTNNHYYVGVCQKIIDLSHGDIEKHKNICMKLIRNLGHYSQYFKFLNSKPEDCTNLNNWVYNSMKKYKIPDNIIDKCFQDYIDFMRKIHTEPRCSYYPYNNMYEEPVNVIILKIFESNMNIIQSTLDGAYDTINFQLIKYICECIKIYKEMYEKYCPNVDADNKKRNDTCDMLNIFKTTYNSFLSGKSYKNYKIPSLDNDKGEYLAMCPQYNSSSKSTPEANGILPLSAPLNGVKDGDTVGITPYEGAKINAEDSFPSSTDVHVENQNSSMARTVSTAVGTVAGASSVLALLYKFSPARRWVHSGIRGNRGRIGSNFYEGPNELLYDAFKDEDMSTHNTRYNICYGTEGIYE